MNKKRISIGIAMVLIVGLGIGLYLYFNIKQQVENTVKNYNNTLVQAMRRPEPELMDRWTTAKERERVTMYILYLYGKDQKLDAKLTFFKVLDAKFDRQNATVVTDEVWDDRYIDVKTGQELGQQESMHYQGTYKLEKDQHDNWVVGELTVKELQ